MENKAKRTVYIALSIAINIAVAVFVVLLVSKTAVAAKGSDTMYHIYRGDWLLNSMAAGDSWPLYNPVWYNGVELMRYWPPLAAYTMALSILAGTLLKLDSMAVFSGFAVYCGIVYLVGAISWNVAGYLKKRPYTGLFLGVLWFFMPQSIYVLFGEGNLPRALIMAVFPLMFHYLNSFLKEGGKWQFVMIAIMFTVMCSSHAGYTGMVAIATIMYLVIYRLCVFTGSSRLQRGGKRDLFALVSIVAGFLMCGMFLYPALNGGLMANPNNDQTVVNFFQSIFISLDPVGKIKGGYTVSYFGLISFLTAVFGIIAGKRRSRPAFITAVVIILLTTETASPVIRSLPGGNLMWMLRFFQIASAMILYGLLEWDSLKKPAVIVVSALLALDCLCSYDMFSMNKSYDTMEECISSIAEIAPIEKAKNMTVSRFALMDGEFPLGNGVFYLTDYNGSVNQAYGKGWEAASDSGTIARINEAFDMGYYDFMFDRLLELGCDTIMVKQDSAVTYPYNEDQAEISAGRCGYTEVLTENGYTIYHLDEVTGTYGTVSEFDGIAIGTGAYYITMIFPSIDEAESEYIDDFTADELAENDIIYLDGFSYHDAKAAEDLIEEASLRGTKVVIFADGIPENRHSRTKRFLGVEAQPITFDNGFPPLFTKDRGVTEVALFPNEYRQWATCYMNGLAEVKGWSEILGETIPFYGTGDNENLIFLGYNLTYYYSLTRDRNVGALLSEIIPETERDLPVRSIVPIDITYAPNSITVDSPRAGVNTSIAEHDIFEGDFYTHKRMVFVDEGRTVIRMHYPHIAGSILMSISGIAITAAGFILIGKRRDEDSNNNPVP